MAAIIVYFSRKDENYVSGTIKKLAVGNTEVAANILQKLTGAELFKDVACARNIRRTIMNVLRRRRPISGVMQDRN